MQIKKKKKRNSNIEIYNISVKLEVFVTEYKIQSLSGIMYNTNTGRKQWNESEAI